MIYHGFFVDKSESFEARAKLKIPSITEKLKPIKPL